MSTEKNKSPGPFKNCVGNTSSLMGKKNTKKQNRKHKKTKMHVACHTDLISQQENGDSDFLDPKKRLQPRWSSTGHNKLLASKFCRNPYRQSLGNRPDMFKWFEAQERQEERFKDVSGFCHF